jgi:hypothetical protein
VKQQHGDCVIVAMGVLLVSQAQARRALSRLVATYASAEVPVAENSTKTRGCIDSTSVA